VHFNGKLTHNDKNFARLAFNVKLSQCNLYMLGGSVAVKRAVILNKIYHLRPLDTLVLLRLLVKVITYSFKPSWTLFHKTLWILKLRICNYGQILTVNLLVNCQNSVIYGHFVVNYLEKSFMEQAPAGKQFVASS